MAKTISTNPLVRLFIGQVSPLIRVGARKPLEEEPEYLSTSQIPKRAVAQVLPFGWHGYLLRHSLVLGTPYLLIPQTLQFLDPQPDGPSLWISSGVGLAFLLFGAQVVQSICSNLAEVMSIEIMARVSAVLTDALYKKALRLSPKARSSFTEGKIINMISSDSEQISTLFQYLDDIWRVPVHITICVVLLSKLIGYAVWTAAGIIILFTLLQGFFGARIGGAVGGYMRSMDKRVKVIREFLYGVRFVKYNAVEDYFAKEIEERRRMQTRALWGYTTSLIGISSSVITQQILIPVVAFITYSSLGGSMRGSTPFAAFGLFETLLEPLLNIPTIAQFVTQAYVSHKRVNGLLFAEEIQPDEVIAQKEKDISPLTAISIESAFWTWELVEESSDKPSANTKEKEKEKEEEECESESTGSHPFALSDISLTIPRGSLVAVVGRVGSGKSSLLSALAGSMRKTQGQASLYGSRAVCTQTPWVLTGTIAENISFNPAATSSNSGSSKNTTDPRIAAAASACILDDDLLTLSNGLQTEIGEKGVTLSGGQKARVALARAVYSNADIHLLDDPIAALDAHVGKKVFEETICGVLRKEGVV
ncbi:hypothetical protein HK102_001146 [Quaeritorhiza haematococci]|nr:hypothetical protein HK102_001146 [Quaeritorhiza haematococci]